MSPFIRTIALLIFVSCLGACTRCGGRSEPLIFPDEEIGVTWFPAPKGRYGLQIVENPRRNVQEVWFRHLRRDDRDRVVDELRGPASLSWSPDNKYVVINHRDYTALFDFIVMQWDGETMVDIPGLMDHVQDLWHRVYPQPMQRLAFIGVRWEEFEGDWRLMVVGLGEPEGNPDRLERQAFWLDPRDGIVRLAENPPELNAMRSPFFDTTPVSAEAAPVGSAPQQDQ